MPFICHPTQMSLASQVKSKGICFKNQILGYMVWRKTVQNCFKIDKIISPKTSKEQKAILAISNIRFGQLDHSEKAVPTGYSKYDPQRWFFPDLQTKIFEKVYHDEENRRNVNLWSCPFAAQSCPFHQKIEHTNYSILVIHVCKVSHLSNVLRAILKLFLNFLSFQSDYSCFLDFWMLDFIPW